MGLETGTYINSLNIANPSANDQVSQGDDHLRLIKSTIKNTFPNITGAVTPTHTELNFVDGVTSAIQAQIDLKSPLASPAFTGTPTAPTATEGVNTTQLATTAFVNRHQRKFRSVTGAVTSNTTLTSADVGKFIEARPTTSATITLPDTSTLALGDTITIYNRDVSTSIIPITIARSGTDVIITGPTGSATSISLSPGECVTLIATSGNWFIEGTYALAASYKYFEKTAAAWVRAGVSLNIISSYNITSLTDDQTGQVTVNIANDMSSANYAVVASSVGGAGSVVANSLAVGSFILLHYNSSWALADPTNTYCAAVFGDY